MYVIIIYDNYKIHIKKLGIVIVYNDVQSVFLYRYLYILTYTNLYKLLNVFILYD